MAENDFGNFRFRDLETASRSATPKKKANPPTQEMVRAMQTPIAEAHKAKYDDMFQKILDKLDTIVNAVISTCDDKSQPDTIDDTIDVENANTQELIEIAKSIFSRLRNITDESQDDKTSLVNNIMDLCETYIDEITSEQSSSDDSTDDEEEIDEESLQDTEVEDGEDETDDSSDEEDDIVEPNEVTRVDDVIDKLYAKVQSAAETQVEVDESLLDSLEDINEDDDEAGYTPSNLKAYADKVDEAIPDAEVEELLTKAREARSDRSIQMNYVSPEK